MPSHILVNNLGLTYKGTIGVSTATLPDVCKTPSPGGPVPIPYPNFANQGSLNKGTKTVKAKGKMIAVKGSEYSTSFGDEPGTAGGIKSSTFKKETSWITYSFDVKMDGKNACRHTDKKFHNHKNTADLQGNMDPTPPAVPFVVNIDCKQKMHNPEPGKEPWDNCMCKQLCAKIKKMDDARKKGKIVPTPGARNSTDYKPTKTKFINDFMERVKAGKGVRSKFIHKCAADKYMDKIHPEKPNKGRERCSF